MLILALDTSSATGSAAIVRDGEIVVERLGDPARTHGERLPHELMTVLRVADTPLDHIDRFAVSIGPGSFTGLRVGIATMQGLSLARGKLVTPVSSFEALASSIIRASIVGHQPSDIDHRGSPIDPGSSAAGSRRAVLGPETPVGVWIDAHRGEVFAMLYDGDGGVLRAPSSLTPDATLDAWSEAIAGKRVVFAGDGTNKYRAAIVARLGEAADIPATVPPLAGAVGLIAAREPDRGVRPHAVVPLYVRRSDAELARDRRHTG
jgi:tRNA threonylcarbamoyladenosine biosynthesis protein TsaB